jgi:retron-type reverse transcriptase
VRLNTHYLALSKVMCIDHDNFMKRIGNLYQQVYSFDNLLISYYAARKRKSAKNYAIDFEWNLEKELLQIQKELRDKTYEPGKYQQFKIYDPKLRDIFVAPFHDRIVHHALYNVIEPIFDKGFIYDSYACRKGKGTHQGMLRLKSFLMSLNKKCGGRDFYVLKCDIRKYFDSVDKDILFSLLTRKIKDKDILWLVNKIINSTFGSKGMPIGNLTSQLFANVYLNELDKFIKHNLKVKYYVRYVDDFILLSESRRQLKEWRNLVREFLKNELLLELHPQKQEICPAKIGVDFLGFHIFYSHILLRQSIIRRFWKKFKKGQMKNASFWSYFGHFKFSDWFGLKRKIENKLKDKYSLEFYESYTKRTADFS